ncbi:hypothetical protein PTKIN_Ptkin07bG0109100 [Pterospermum kingtungense]
MGIPGWRFAFHLVWIISVVVGILVRLFANDPRFSYSDSRAKEQAAYKSFKAQVKDLIKEAKSVMRIPTFQILIAQGVLGSFPWSALSFAPMWLELIGFTQETTAFIMTLFVISGSFGALFGGKMGDILASRWPYSGRIILSQISSGSAIPLAAILLLALPDDPNTAFMHGVVFFIVGLIITWNAAATNNPIFAEIVPEKSRTSIYALDRSFESILASFAPAIALYTAIGTPIAICCLIYSFLYYTYPRDRERARIRALIESEMQQLDENNSPSSGRQSEFCVVDSEKSEIYIEFGEESLDFEDSDEKSLLNHRLASQT